MKLLGGEFKTIFSLQCLINLWTSLPENAMEGISKTSERFSQVNEHAEYPLLQLMLQIKSFLGTLISCLSKWKDVVGSRSAL